MGLPIAVHHAPLAVQHSKAIPEQKTRLLSSSTPLLCKAQSALEPRDRAGPKASVNPQVREFSQKKFHGSVQVPQGKLHREAASPASIFQLCLLWLFYCTTQPEQRENPTCNSSSKAFLSVVKSGCSSSLSLQPLEDGRKNLGSLVGAWCVFTHPRSLKTAHNKQK